MSEGGTHTTHDTHAGATLRVPGDVSIAFSTLLPSTITFAGRHEALRALATQLRELAARIEATS